jgi:flagellar basal-body rod modification protein FlgD
MTTVAPTAQQSFLDSVATGATAQRQEGLQDRFLTLLVTQLRNQDPLNPLDNAEVTSQLAQISTVSGIETLNQSVNNMSISFLAAQSVQAGSLIGRGVLGPGTTLLLEEGGARGGIVLEQPADRVTVTISAPNGEVMTTLELGAQAAGPFNFTWNGSTDGGGTAAAGSYQFEVVATQQGRKVNAGTLGFGRVESVTLGTDRLVLDTRGLGPLGLDQVWQILQ